MKSTVLTALQVTVLGLATISALLGELDTAIAGIAIAYLATVVKSYPNS